MVSPQSRISGRAIFHPSSPGPMDVTSSHSFLPLTLLEPALPPDFIYNLTSGGSGQHNFEVNNVYFSFPYEPECLYCLVPYYR